MKTTSKKGKKKKELFCRNVGEVVHSSHIRCIAVPVVEECGGHLLTIILMAKALGEVNNVHNWEYASQALDLEINPNSYKR